MTKHIHYTGPSDSYSLDAGDLKKADVEGFKKTVFPINTPVEVSDEAAEALVGNKSELFGQFAESSDEDLKKAGVERKADEPDVDQGDTSSMIESGTPQITDGEGDALPGMPAAGRGSKAPRNP